MNKKLVIIISVILIVIIAATTFFLIFKNKNRHKPEEVLINYISLINEQNYEKMYNLISNKSKEQYTKEEFIKRIKNIYSGIDMNDMKLEINNIEKIDSTHSNITYKISMQTIAGEVLFTNTTSLTKDENKQYKIDWSSNIIYPELNNEDKLRVETLEAQRGSILDRNGIALATNGIASSVGLVPGKMNDNPEEDLQKIANLLDISVDSINSDLSASYVKEDTFVPIKTISKNATELKESLLSIKGIMITDIDSRVYPYSEATSHLTGYIQGISAEELENAKSKEYDENSNIGKIGLEKAWEHRLKGENGYEIYIEDNKGSKKKTIINKPVKNGEEIKTTINITIQEKLYNSIKEDKGFFVVMQPITGEILALVSTPSYNSNDFVLGFSNNKWNSVQNDERNLFLNRFTQKWSPGSTFKPITGAIGLTSGKLDANEDFGKSGLEWQNNESWGNYFVTTLTPYDEPANLKNALIRSDNIYFAKAALKIGNNTFVDGLNKLGFGEKLPFELDLSKSQVSNSGTIDKEVLLADSGYGQGQILVNPIHMASIYSAFLNEGNMVKPYIEYKENPNTEYWKTNIFTKEAANTIKDDLLQVVENPNGTAHDAKVSGTKLAGKTGTAETEKVNTSDKGKTLGWFDCFTVDANNPLLIISMVEDVNSR